MASFNSKRVADPVHKTIGLSDLEIEIINCASFLRLQNVNQLGLAHLVFPGANYSRFSHCLGVCHITGRILDSIRTHCPDVNLRDEDIQLYRLAALLHDIAHYPFSHAMEQAIENFYAESFFESDGETAEEEGTKFFKHERAGREVLEKDEELSSALLESGFQPRDVYSIFLRENPGKLNNLISSDMDADRIDYLLRTAHHAGLPYGSVDLSYLLTQMRVDGSGRICLTPKARNAADHFLLCRYFDYQQVAFHKTVAALELLLKDVLYAVLRDGFVSASAGSVVDKISSGAWRQFDDAFMLAIIRTYARETEDEIARRKARAILQRQTPKLVYGYHSIGTREKHGEFRILKGVLINELPRWADRYGIDRRFW
jgi:HD superfamily phosphohydrolase